MIWMNQKRPRQWSNLNSTLISIITFFIIEYIGQFWIQLLNIEIKKYVKIELDQVKFGETGLDVIKIDVESNYNDSSLSAGEL